jgi:hypothetical protein
LPPTEAERKYGVNRNDWGAGSSRKRRSVGTRVRYQAAIPAKRSNTQVVQSRGELAVESACAGLAGGGIPSGGAIAVIIRRLSSVGSDWRSALAADTEAGGRQE